jgi:hypothetical protein
MIHLATISRLVSAIFILGVVLLGAAAVYLNVFVPYYRRKRSRRSWDVHEK